MDKIYYLAEEPPKVNHAGNKARLDVDYVLKRKDYVPYITMLQHKNHCFKDKIRCLISVDLNP